MGNEHENVGKTKPKGRGPGRSSLSDSNLESAQPYAGKVEGNRTQMDASVPPKAAAITSLIFGTAKAAASESG